MPLKNLLPTYFLELIGIHHLSYLEEMAVRIFSLIFSLGFSLFFSPSFSRLRGKFYQASGKPNPVCIVSNIPFLCYARAGKYDISLRKILLGTPLCSCNIFCV